MRPQDSHSSSSSMIRYQTDDEGVVLQPEYTLTKPSNGPNDRDHLIPRARQQPTPDTMRLNPPPTTPARPVSRSGDRHGHATRHGAFRDPHRRPAPRRVTPPRPPAGRTAAPSGRGSRTAPVATTAPPTPSTPRTESWACLTGARQICERPLRRRLRLVAPRNLRSAR